MKISEIISEGLRIDDLNLDDEDQGLGDGLGDESYDHFPEPEMELSSNADTKMINAVRKVCDSYKGQGHAQVELLPFLTKVMEIVGKPVNLADLISINKKSQEIQALVDTIDEKKVKFKNMSVKNEDPGKAKEKQDATVSGMASRALGKRK